MVVGLLAAVFAVGAFGGSFGSPSAAAAGGLSGVSVSNSADASIDLPFGSIGRVSIAEFGSFVQQGLKLTGGGEVGAGGFGYSVAFSADGNAALIGGSDNSGVGAVWVFTRSGSTWTQQGPKLTGGGETGPWLLR